jgi:hypothetical protein
MPRASNNQNAQPTPPVQPEQPPATDAAAAAELYGKAKEEKGGLTLIPSRKVKSNDTVEAVKPVIERDGMVVCKRK